MSDGKVREALEQMEAWLADLNWVPDVEALAQWDADYHVALAQAEQGPGWADLIARAHAAGQQLEDRTAVFAGLRDQLRKDIEAQERGNRALRGYGASSR